MTKTKKYNPNMQEINGIGKGKLLYLFLFPLFLSVIIALFEMKIIAFVLNGVAFMLLFGVVYLSKKGFAQEQSYERAIFAKAPKIKYKSLAAILLGITTFYTAAVAGGEPIMYALIWAIVSVAGYILYYGLDPIKDKLEDFGDLSSQIVLETFEEAQSKLAKIAADNKHIKDNELRSKITIALERASNILDAIAADPKDIRSARKFLIVYIDGVAKVTSSYIAVDESDIDSLTREKLLNLIQDVEVRFEKEMQRLKANNKFDLDVQIDVLKQQIKN